MEQKIIIATGGLVLQSIDLRKILKEKDCIGLAFGLPKSGSSTNVDLRVYKVTHNGQEFVGIEYPIENKKGAAGFDQRLGSIHQFCFEYHQYLRKCSFDFAFLSAADFDTVWRNGEEEVFIAGALKNFGHTAPITGEWFTLTISPRSEIRLESPRQLSLPPQMKHMESCPPRWTLQERTYLNTKMNGEKRKIRFQANQLG